MEENKKHNRSKLHGFLMFVGLFIFLLQSAGIQTQQTSKNITLKVNSELYDKYREICKKEGWIVSRQFEKLMEEEMKKRG